MWRSRYLEINMVITCIYFRHVEVQVFGDKHGNHVYLFQTRRHIEVQVFGDKHGNHVYLFQTRGSRGIRR